MELSDALGFVRSHRNGVLVTQKRDGRPQMSNIVYAVGADGIIRVSVTADRAKARNAARDPRVSLHVTDDEFGIYCVVEADVVSMPAAADPADPTADSLVEYYQALAGEHPDWAEYRQAMVDDGRLVLLLTPTHAYGMLSR
jgi:PPOX class probable F420-dependent enzyme